MTTPTYKGPGQPAPATSAGIGGWLGGLLGATSPVYKTPTPAPVVTPPVVTPPVVTTPPACPPCKAWPMTPAQAAGSSDVALAAPTAEPCDAFADAVIPVGPGPITIVIQPRS
jgi:hypothetical protein